MLSGLMTGFFAMSIRSAGITGETAGVPESAYAEATLSKLWKTRIASARAARPKNLPISRFLPYRCHSGSRMRRPSREIFWASERLTGLSKRTLMKHSPFWIDSGRH